jgi:hypothetical protein
MMRDAMMATILKSMLLIWRKRKDEVYLEKKERRKKLLQTNKQTKN